MLAPAWLLEHRWIHRSKETARLVEVNRLPLGRELGIVVTEGCTDTVGLSLGDDEGAPDTDGLSDGACDGSVEMLGPPDGWLDGPLALVEGDIDGEEEGSWLTLGDSYSVDVGLPALGGLALGWLDGFTDARALRRHGRGLSAHW